MLLEKIKKRASYAALPQDLKNKLIFHKWILFDLRRTGNLDRFQIYQEDRLQTIRELNKFSIDLDPSPEITEENEERILFYLLARGFRL